MSTGARVGRGPGVLAVGAVAELVDVGGILLQAVGPDPRLADWRQQTGLGEDLARAR